MTDFKARLVDREIASPDASGILIVFGSTESEVRRNILAKIELIPSCYVESIEGFDEGTGVTRRYSLGGLPTI